MRCVCHVCCSTLKRAADGVNAQVFMNSVERVRSVIVLVCVIHGTNDDVVPVENGKDIVAALGSKAAYPALYVPAGHNDIEALHGPRFVAYIVRFLEYTANIAALPFTRHMHE